MPGVDCEDAVDASRILGLEFGDLYGSQADGFEQCCSFAVAVKERWSADLRLMV